MRNDRLRRSASPFLRLLSSLPLFAFAGLASVACSADGSGGAPGRPTTTSSFGSDAGVDDGADAATDLPPYPSYDETDGAATTTPVYRPDASAYGAGSGTGNRSGSGNGHGSGTTMGSGSGSDGSSASACEASTGCPSPMLNLGNVAGDKGNESQHASGTGSTWLKVRVTERDFSPIAAVALKLHATLTSPVGSNFDLFLYPSASTKATDLECSTAGAASRNLTSTDEAVLAFADRRVHEDSRNVTIEVRHVSGPCTADAPWSLLIEGNAQ